MTKRESRRVEQWGLNNRGQVSTQPPGSLYIIGVALATAAFWPEFGVLAIGIGVVGAFGVTVLLDALFYALARYGLVHHYDGLMGEIRNG